MKIEDIEVSEIEITGENIGQVGDKIQLTINIVPNFIQNAILFWNSSDENIATVDENGIVTIKQIGEVTIDVKLKDNENITASHLIKIPQYNSINFEYVGNSQEYNIPVTGKYKIECWGAQGGDIDTYMGGKGAYTVGEIDLEKGTKLYVYVGGKGTNSDIGGYNGGASLTSGQSIYGSSGGGATDIRIVNGEWNNTKSLISRIMVAAGGGGANNRNRIDSNYKYGAGNGGAGRRTRRNIRSKCRVSNIW